MFCLCGSPLPSIGHSSSLSLQCCMLQFWEPTLVWSSCLHLGPTRLILQKEKRERLIISSWSDLELTLRAERWTEQPVEGNHCSELQAKEVNPDTSNQLTAVSSGGPIFPFSWAFSCELIEKEPISRLYCELGLVQSKYSGFFLLREQYLSKQRLYIGAVIVAWSCLDRNNCPDRGCTNSLI